MSTKLRLPAIPGQLALCRCGSLPCPKCDKCAACACLCNEDWAQQPKRRRTQRL